MEYSPGFASGGYTGGKNKGYSKGWGGGWGGSWGNYNSGSGSYSVSGIGAGPTSIKGRLTSGYNIKVMDLPRYPQVDASMIRQRLRDNLGRMGFDWALGNLVDVHATYTAEFGMGCGLSVVAITLSAYQCPLICNRTCAVL